MKAGAAARLSDVDIIADDTRALGRLLTSAGVALMGSSALNAALGVASDAWTAFASHWDDLVLDAYAAELGTHRLRRYGHFLFREGVAEPLAHETFVQPQNSNPLYLNRDRHFQPLTDAFAADPLLQALLAMLGQVATTLQDCVTFSAKVTPFRVLATADAAGQPAPEGVHRDGVTLVTSLLINRDNAIGGQSSVFDLEGAPLVSTTLSTPGTLLLGDDRRTRHGVSPIRPADPSRPAKREVLVITFAPLSAP